VSLRTRGAAALTARLARVVPVALVALVALVVLLGLTAAGCSAGPVEIDAPRLSAADARACRDLVAALPRTLAGQPRRDLSGDTAYGAAWGDPAIVLTCGWGVPSGFGEASTCIQVDRTGWYVPDEVIDEMLRDNQDVDVAMTEMNYRPRVHVLLPADYRPDGFTNTTAALADVIAAHLQRVGRCH
jgi:hypothetical protein